MLAPGSSIFFIINGVFSREESDIFFQFDFSRVNSDVFSDSLFYKQHFFWTVLFQSGFLFRIESNFFKSFFYKNMFFSRVVSGGTLFTRVELGGFLNRIFYKRCFSRFFIFFTGVGLFLFLYGSQIFFYGRNFFSLFYHSRAWEVFFFFESDIFFYGRDFFFYLSSTTVVVFLAFDFESDLKDSGMRACAVEEGAMGLIPHTI